MAARRPVGIGLVGLGFMGLTHLRAAKQLKGGRMVAIATKDKKKAKGNFAGVQGNFGAAGAREDLSGITVHSSLADLLADESVDLVDVCLPSYLHAKVSTQCLKAGKHVLVEKPIALKPAEANRMIQTARSRGKLLMVAQVLKFFPEFAALAKAVQSERFGALRSLHCRRVIARPDWADDNWLADPKRSGGMVVDLHIHDTDMIVYLFGRPKAIRSSGIVMDGQIASIRTTYDFGKKGPLISSEAGWINAPSLPFEHGYDAWFDRATVQYNSTSTPEPCVFGPKTVRSLPLPKGDAFTLELQAAVDSVRSGQIDPRISPLSAATSLEICAAEVKAVKSGLPVKL